MINTVFFLAGALLPIVTTIVPCFTSLNIEMASACVKLDTDVPLMLNISSPKNAKGKTISIKVKNFK